MVKEDDGTNIYSPYHACQAETCTKEMALGDKQDPDNPFGWSRGVRNFPGSTTYDCF